MKEKKTAKIPEEAHCPYCSNHCPLTKPKCHKGRELAQALEAAAPGKAHKTEKTDKNSAGAEEFYSLIKELTATEKDRKKDKDLSRQILLYLSQQGAAEEEAVGKSLSVKAGTLHGTVNSLKKKKLIHCYKEGKGTRIVLSREGQKKINRKKDADGKDLKSRFSRLTEEEQAQLIGLLHKLHQTAEVHNVRSETTDLQ